MVYVKKNLGSTGKFLLTKMDGHYFLCIFLCLKDWLLLITRKNLYLPLLVSILADGFHICLKYTETDIHFIILIKIQHKCVLSEKISKLLWIIHRPWNCSLPENWPNFNYLYSELRFQVNWHTFLKRYVTVKLSACSVNLATQDTKSSSADLTVIPHQLTPLLISSWLVSGLFKKDNAR